MTLDEATKVFDKLVASKARQGLPTRTGEAAKPYQQSGDEGRDSGIRCQLLNPIEKSELSRLLTGRTHCLQEKHDGRRLMVRKQGDTITGINRRGLVVAIPDAIREAVEHIPFDVLIDGEAVGDTLHAFDLLEVKGNDLRQRRYIDRFAGLIMVIPPNLPALRWVSTSVDPNDKIEIYEELRSTNREGVVFKDVDAPLQPGPSQLRRTAAEVQVRRERVVRRHRHQRQTQRHARPLRWRQAGPRRQRHHPAEPPAFRKSESVCEMHATSTRLSRAAASTSRSISARAPTSRPPNASSSSSNTRPSPPASRRLIPHQSRQGPAEASPVARHAAQRDRGNTGRHGASPKLHGGHFLFQLHNYQPNHPMKITSVIITPMPRPMPEGMFDPMPEVVATFEDGSTKNPVLVLSRRGLVPALRVHRAHRGGGHSLFQQKDTAYLRS